MLCVLSLSRYIRDFSRSGNQENEGVLVIEWSPSLNAFCHGVFYKLLIQRRIEFNQSAEPVEDVVRVLQVESAKPFIWIVKQWEIAGFLFLFCYSRDSCK